MGNKLQWALARGTLEVAPSPDSVASPLKTSVAGKTKKVRYSWGASLLTRVPHHRARLPSPGLEAGEGKEFALGCELLKPQDCKWLPVLAASRQGSCVFVLPGTENITSSDL